MVRLSPRLALYLYLAVLPLPSLVHEPLWLAGGLVFAFLLAGNKRWQIFKRSLLAILTFNLTISLGVIIIGFWQNKIEVTWLLLANLRVLLMVFLGFWFVTRVSLVAALAGWPTATFLATLVLGQTRSFERLLRDFRLAFSSRCIVKPLLRDRLNHASAQAITLLDKAQAQSTEVSLALRSRGAFE